MTMTVKHMFGALAVSAAAAMLAACGRPLDPQAAPAVPVAQALVAAPDEALTASTTVNRIDNNAVHGFDVPVKGVEACLNAAKEQTYRANRNTMTSCIGQNGHAYARFACAAPSNQPITCSPF